MNQLMQPPQQQPMLGMQQPQFRPQAPVNQPDPQQIMDAHGHLSDLQKAFGGLLKKPDSDMTLKELLSVAADLVGKNQESGGKRGVSAMAIAQEISDPNFPHSDDKGNPPSAAAIRQFVQKCFDAACIHQAAISAKFGAPQPKMQEQP